MFSSILAELVMGLHYFCLIFLRHDLHSNKMKQPNGLRYRRLGWAALIVYIDTMPLGLLDTRQFGETPNLSVPGSLRPRRLWHRLSHTLDRALLACRPEPILKRRHDRDEMQRHISLLIPVETRVT